jgi:beta-galactosidase
MVYNKISALFFILTMGWFCAGGQGLGVLFDDHWKFALGEQAGASEKGFDDNGWRNVELPHDWSIEGAPERPNPSKGAGGYFPTGVGWYRKAFAAPVAWKGNAVSILFEGVYMNAEVFVNGRSLGVHPYGYSTFYYDITRFLDWGRRNVIAVRVDNSQQVNCRWYSGSGIYRHVRIAVKAPLHIDPWQVAITTPVVGPDKALVGVAAVVKNDPHVAGDVVLSTVIVDHRDRVVARDSVRVRTGGKGEAPVERRMTVLRPMLWSVDSPWLYRVKMVLTRGGRRKDEYVSTVGIRKIEFSVENGFRLNGKTIKLYGGCIHHDNGCIGAVAIDRAEERKVGLLKAAGFNALRTSHNPPSPALLDACDRLGVLVIDEAFDGWREAKNANDYTRFFDAWWRRDLESMVLRDRNHPSVIIWSVGNEILERKSPGAIRTAGELVAAVHQYDMTRPVTSAMTTWDKEWEMYDPLFAVQDIGGYNYQLFRAASDHLRVPSRIIVQTESYARDAFANWKIIRDNSYVIGDFVWTAMDYLGESGIGKNNYPGEPRGEFWESEQYPWHGAYCGDLDLTGWRKPVSHYRNILNNGVEKLYMAVREPKPDTGSIQETLWSVWPTRESWTWPGKDGKEMEVEVYSRYPKVRLYLNDQLVGEKSCMEEEEFKATFSLPYAPGELRAIGVGPGESAVLRTAGEPVAIRLSADRKTLAADGQDLSYIAVEIVDKDGVIDPNADNRLVFKVEGPAVLAGVGNADMTDMDKYVGDTRKAWHGRALAVVRSTHRRGKITLTVTGDGLKKGVMVIN